MNRLPLINTTKSAAETTTTRATLVVVSNIVMQRSEIWRKRKVWTARN